MNVANDTMPRSVTLLGPARGGDTLRLHGFMTRNSCEHEVIDTDHGGVDVMAHYGVSQCDLPALVLDSDRVMKNPTRAEIAEALAITEQPDPNKVYDVVIVGAGPAGLAAAVCGACEGLSVMVIEKMAPGGQAGTSSHIENYLGFPTGISGQALSERAQAQAEKFGATFSIARSAARLDCTSHPYRVQLDDNTIITSHTVVVATGARYRKLDLPRYGDFEGYGIHYAASGIEANLCRDSEVAVVGGGNSAGQAAMFLSSHAKHVHILVRGAGLADTMSDYLLARIEGCANITVHCETEVTELRGDDYLSGITVTHRSTDATRDLAVGNLFVMIGAQPNTEWLQNCLSLDDKGFVLTGNGADASSPFETSEAGVFAVGDVRSESVKRVASGVGEGSIVVPDIYAYVNR